MTQCERIIAYIENFGEITPYEAFKDLGITKLATRISEILKEGNYPIIKEWRTSTNRYGDQTQYRAYKSADNEKVYNEIKLLSYMDSTEQIVCDRSIKNLSELCELDENKVKSCVSSLIHQGRLKKSGEVLILV